MSNIEMAPMRLAPDPVEGRLLVDGEWIVSEEWEEVRSPYSGDVVGRIPRVGATVASRAVDAAARALTQPLQASRRAELLERTAALVRENREDLARLVVAETGKPIRQARVEVDRCAFTYRMAAVEANTLTGEMVPMDAAPGCAGKVGFTLRLPVGIVAAITPFNFPLNLAAHKLAPALAAGCPVVLKPAPQAPLSALALARLAVEAGLPPGWLNVVFGDAAAIGDVLLDDRRVALVTFTGSAAVGWSLRDRAPRKRVTLELGNATPVIVEADADLDLAAERIVSTAFGYAGQACISVQRVYVRREVHEALLERLLPRVEALVVGDPDAEETDVGPLIDVTARDRVMSWLQEARAGGAEVLAGGAIEDGVLRPTVLGSVSDAMRICREEVFGPVVTVLPYDDFDAALESCNDSSFGLQAGIFTRDIGRAFAAAKKLEFGGVIVNDSPSFRVDQMPYGGIKHSGTGQEGPARAVREMTYERLVVLDTGDGGGS